MNGLLAVVLAWAVTGGEKALPDDPVSDVRPGFSFSCRAKFDLLEPEHGWVSVVHKGSPNEPGAYWLRLSHKPEASRFDFFVNLGDGPEPRVSSAVKPEVGKWYDLAAGWDGTNAWLTVNGQTTRVRRDGTGCACEGNPALGWLKGEIADFRFNQRGLMPKSGAASGFRLGCDVTFAAFPEGETRIAEEKGVYQLRYDSSGGKSRQGAFNFFVNLDGSWEPRATIRQPIELGRTYRLCCGWDGLRSTLSVDGASSSVGHSGLLSGKPGAFLTGDSARLKVTNFAFRNERKPRVVMKDFRTVEYMPPVGRPLTVVGEIFNFGEGVSDVVVEARDKNGAAVTPATLPLDEVKVGSRRKLEWTVAASENRAADLVFTAKAGGKTLFEAGKRFYLLPREMPEWTAKTWCPPIRETTAHYIDADAGDDANDGRSPAKAWKSFKNVNGRTLGPGERVLLKRGCVFNEELRLSAKGAPDNWAEIGAYGEGMRPQIRRSRFLDERCGFVDGAWCLAVRDLIFCNAGSGFEIIGDGPEFGHVLVERCLAHHVEGHYRFNSHGIPEWRDHKGVDAKHCSRSCGIAVLGGSQQVVMRDCESYQCSSGFRASGSDVFVSRMFCHDNYAHNTSPHPYNLSSRAWMTDSVFDASGWHAAAGTMGIMLWDNNGFVIRNCHFLNQPDSGSPDQGSIDFEAKGDNCLIDRCTFRNNAGAPIEVLGLQTPQPRNVLITRCRFDRNNWAYKNGPAEISVWGERHTSPEIACSNGRIEDNGCVLVPGVPFYRNDGPSTNGWTLSGNRTFDFPEQLDAAYPWGDPPAVDVCGEIWTDRREAALAAKVTFNPEDRGAKTSVAWEQVEGRPGVRFEKGPGACAKAVLPGEGDYRVQVKADDGTFWRTARTAVHVLPEGAVTYKAWDFAKNLDTQGWEARGTGAGYEFLPGKTGFWNSKSHPVRLVCGDYYVIAIRDATGACLVTPETMDVGVAFSAARCNAVRIRMQNRTNARRMRLWWQTTGPVNGWDKSNSVAFDVKPDDPDDTVYTAKLPSVGGIKQLKLAFSDGTEPITGTCRIDYIWLGRLR